MIPKNRKSLRLLTFFSAQFMACVFLLGGYLSVRADETSDSMNVLKHMSLDELVNVQINTVLGASKHEQDISDAPANVTVLSSDEIRLYGWRTLGEALRSVSGVVVTYDRGYAYIGVRGFDRPGDYSGRVLITIDGHRMNDAMYDTSAMDTDFPLDLDLIDRIEVIRGPGSTLYGNNAFFGVINIVTRNSKSVHDGEISGSYGTFNTYTGRATFGHNFTNGVGLVLSGSWYDSAGNPSLFYPEFLKVNDGIAHNMDGGHAYNFFGSITWKDWTFEGGYGDRFKRVPTAIYTYPDAGEVIAFNDPRFHTVDARGFVDLKYNHTFTDDWRLTVRGYFDYYRYDGDYPYHYNPTDPLDPVTVNVDYEQSESVGGEVQLSRTLFKRHYITIGSEARYDYALALENYDLLPRSIYVNAHRHNYFTGIYAQDEFKVRDNLLLDAGVRYDYFDSVGSTFSPRAALIYHPWKPSTIKLLYGQAYRAPDASENYYSWPIPPGGTELKPETIRTYEVVYEHRFNQVWQAKTAFFYNELKNLITYGDTQAYVNLPSVTTEGIESELSAHFANELSGRFSYTYANAKDGSTGLRLANSPEHMVKLNLAVPVWKKKLFASTEVQFMSRRSTVSGDHVPGYWLVNAGLFSREIVPGLEVSLSVYNLFDTRYSDPATSDFLQPAIEQNGRTLRIKATWRF